MNSPLKLFRACCNHHLEAAPGAQLPISSGDHINTGMIGPPASIAAARAALSARRRSLRNQIMEGAGDIIIKPNYTKKLTLFINRLARFGSPLDSYVKLTNMPPWIQPLLYTNAVQLNTTTPTTK
jgi:hypothetical protein